MAPLIKIHKNLQSNPDSKSFQRKFTDCVMFPFLAAFVDIVVLERDWELNSSVQLESDEKGVVETSPTGRYVRYDEVLGSGAFKVVYKGFDQIDGIEIAWSQIPLNDDSLLSPARQERLLDEATLLKSLKHENITKCFCSWVDNETKTINMITELFCSGNLREFRRKHKGVDIKAIKNWGRQILKGLHYLHTHDPPIVHRDLKCANVFVNGNHAQVKIGDLGFATVLREGAARTVIGTPEFMAPELFENDYDERIDIYAFGMCLLELVTCEYPYSECKNAGHVYKKILLGEKPHAFGKVKDPKVKEFIEKCLLPASQRLPAIELLNDPFLSCDNSMVTLMSKPLDMPKLDTQTSMKTSLSSPLSVSVSSSCTNNGNQISSTLWSTKSRCSHQGKELRLQGRKVNEKLISFIFSFTCIWEVKKFEFSFDLDSDTTLLVARELVEVELSDEADRDAEVSNLSIEDIATIAELMDSLLLELAPKVKPSHPNGGHRGAEKSSAIVGGESAVSFVHSYSSLSGDSSSEICLSSIQGDEEKLNGLKVELDAIGFEFQQRYNELLRKREEAAENAKKKSRSRPQTR